MRLSWHCGGILVLPSTKIALIQHHWQLSEHNCQFKVTCLTRSEVALLLLPFAILLHSPSALKLSSITPSVYSGWQLNFWFIYGCSSWSGNAAPAQTFTRTTRRYFEHTHTPSRESVLWGTLTSAEAVRPTEDVLSSFAPSSLRSRKFGRPPAPVKVHHCSQFSPFVDNGCNHGHFSPEALAIAF